jgi:capping protein beta
LQTLTQLKYSLSFLYFRPELAQELLSTVDQPLDTRHCTLADKDFLISDYNRDGDSFRSPYSNTYEPPLSNGTVPSSELRSLEVLANDAFATYRDLYFDAGLSNVYFWDLEIGFAAAVLIQKKQIQGSWNSIHILEILPQGTTAVYKLTSTILLELLHSSNESLGSMVLSGNITRQVSFFSFICFRLNRNSLYLIFNHMLETWDAWSKKWKLK